MTTRPAVLVRAWPGRRRACWSPVDAGAADGCGLDLRRPQERPAPSRRGLNGPAHRPGHSQEHHQRRGNPGTD